MENIMHLVFFISITFVIYNIVIYPEVTYSLTDSIIPRQWDNQHSIYSPLFILTELIAINMPDQSKLVSPHGQTSDKALQLKYDELNHRYQTTLKRLNYLSYIPRIIANKEYEARQDKERASNYENKYHEIHRMYAKLVRSLSTHGTCPNCRSGQSQPTQQRAPIEKLTSRNVQPSQFDISEDVRPKTSGKSRDLFTQLSAPGYSETSLKAQRSKLRVDGAPCRVPPIKISGNASPHVKPPTVKEVIDHLPTQISSGAVQNPVARSYSVPGKLQDIKDGDSHRMSSTTQPEDAQSGLFDVPEVSKKNFDRLAREYTIMKHALVKLEREKDMDMKKYLAVQEYERVIVGLREDLQYTKLQLDELRFINSAVANKDTARIVQKCQDLQKKVSLLERSVRSKQEMIDQFVEMIKKQKDGFPPHTAGQEETSGKHVVVDKTIPAGHGSSTSEAVNSGSEQISQLTTQLADLTVQLEQEKQQYSMKLTRMEQQVMEMKMSLAAEKEGKLTAEENYMELLSNHERLLVQHRSSAVECPESVRELVRENKSLREKNDILNSELRGTLEEKQVLLVQCQLFNDDFGKFQQDYEKNRKSLQEMRDQKNVLEEQLRQFRQSDSKHIKMLESDNEILRAEIQKYRTVHPEGYPRGKAVSTDEGLGPSMPSRESSSGYGSRSSHGGSTRTTSLKSHESGYMTGGSSYSSSGSASAAPLGTRTEYVCPRCDAVFKIYEKHKFEDHITKCVVD